MAAITLKRVADMPTNAQGQRVISGANWDANCSALEGAINGGLDNSNISNAAAISGAKLADGTVTRTKASADFILQDMMYWIDL